MVINKENLTDIKERYEKAQKLFEEDSKHDPVTNPYKSIYESREILHILAQNVQNVLNTLECDVADQTVVNNEFEADIFIYRVILGHVNKELARNFMATDEFSAGERNLRKSLLFIESHKTCAESVILSVETLNDMGLYAIRNDAAESKAFLDRAEKVYQEFKEMGIAPLTISDIFGTKDEVEPAKATHKLETIYTLTLYYQAQVCTKLADLHNSAWYCHKTLKRQLEYNDYDPIDWSLNAAILAQYFLPTRFHESRLHLSAATEMMRQHESRMITPDMNEDQAAAARETFNHRNADLLRCWGKYGIALLQGSIDRLMVDDEDPKEKEMAALPDISSLRIYSEHLQFESLPIDTTENQITDTFCLTFDDAKGVFLKTLGWLNSAREYYNAETEATEYAKIVQDLSALYNLLAFFEDDGSNQCKLHKKRADHLEEIVTKYNPQYYLVVCRESWYELGLIYSKMLDIKLDILNDLGVRPTPHALNKINQLCDKVIKNFTAFLDSYRAKETNEIPPALPFEDLQHILFCYFHIARIHYKKITSDRVLLAVNINNSLKFYNTFVEKCAASEDAVKYFKSELSVSREMITLLPKKLQMLLNEINN